MKTRKSIVTLVLFLALAGGAARALAPRTTAPVRDDETARILEFFAIRDYAEADWERVSPETLARLIRTGNDLAAARRREYERRKAYYAGHRHLPRPGEGLLDYVQEFRDVEGHDCDAFYLENVTTLLERMLSEKTTPAVEPGGFRKWLGRFSRQKKAPSPTVGEDAKAIRKIFANARSRIDPIQEYALVSVSPDRIARVVIVDDGERWNEENRRIVSLFDPGIEIVSASSGEEAWETIRSLVDAGSPPDVVITDQDMPVGKPSIQNVRGVEQVVLGLQGNQLAKRIKDAFPWIYTVLNTGGKTSDLLYLESFDGIVEGKSTEHHLVPILERINIVKTRPEIEARFREAGLLMYFSHYFDYLEGMALFRGAGIGVSA
jgi:CheY-like chemotaxis protein